jgi:hypothetical protein
MVCICSLTTVLSACLILSIQVHTNCRFICAQNFRFF